MTASKAPAKAGPVADGVQRAAAKAPHLARQHGRMPGNQALLRIQRQCSCGGSGTCPACLQKKQAGAAGSLKVGPKDDRFEREADAMADRVMRMPDPSAEDAHGPLSSAGMGVQRKCSSCEEEEESIQRKASGDGPLSVSPSLDSGIRNSRGGGVPMSSDLRGYYEPRFGADFSGVRLHSDSRAASLATGVGAHAFTVGSDIFFAAGQFQPGTDGGRRLLAHELTHTIQQGRGASMGLQRDPNNLLAEEEAPEITEEAARKEIEGDQSGEFEEMSPEETEASDSEEAVIDEGQVHQDAAQLADVVTDEVEIPDFEMSTGGAACVKLWKEEPEKEEEEEGGGIAEAVFEKLLSFATKGTAGAIAGAVGGFLASKAWNALPLSARAAAINLAIDGALKGLSLLPGEVLVGVLWPWFQAGISGFLGKLRSVDDGEKVTLFEKVAGIVLGMNTKAQAGFTIGVVKGFFIDGLLGIVQMILDMLCFVPRALQFIEKFVGFLRTLPEQMEAAADALKELWTAIKAAISGAMDELKDLITNPTRIVELLGMVLEAGRTKAKEIGESIADGMLKFARMPAKKIGEKAGRIVGQLVFEGVVAYLTAGAGATVTVLKAGAKEAVKWVVQLGKKFFELMKRVLPILEDIANAVVRAVKFLTKLFRTVCEKLNQAIQRIIDFFYSILGLCRKGSFKCKIPRHSTKPPADKTKCRGRFVPRLGGYKPHDVYARRVTGRAQDFRIVLGPVRRCTFDAKVVNTLVECKTGYGWLANPVVQAKPWFPWAKAKLRAQSLRCLATATSCGFIYVWYVQNSAAAAYLNTYFAGMPPVLHKP